MSAPDKKVREPLIGTQVVSSVASGGGGNIFQARVAALYLANMLTGAPTSFGLHGKRVRALRVEARYTGAHIDDIYCELANDNQTNVQFIQCKHGLDVVPSNKDFVEGLQAAWRDYLGIGKSPFNRSCDLLILATVAPGTVANRAAKQLCELSRGSTSVADFLKKLESGLFSAQHKRTWNAFISVSTEALSDQYSEAILFALLQRLRIDIHDLGTEASHELSLVQALLDSAQSGESGEQVWNGLFAYISEQGVKSGTITLETWKRTAATGLQAAVSRLVGPRGLAFAAERFSLRAQLQLSLISTSLPNDAHISRSTAIAKIISAQTTHKAVVITGSAGAGKSSVVAELAPILAESGPLFFFRADELDCPALSSVPSLSGIPDSIVGFESLLKSSESPTVVIDSMEKLLEAQERGAIQELLALVHRHPKVRLCVTARSYALNTLFVNFLSAFSLHVVDVPPLTDQEIFEATTGTFLEPLARTHIDLLEVLRAPYYIGLALTHTAIAAALPRTARDLRFLLWSEKIAPSAGISAHLSTRRRAAFDHICYERTARFAQFVGRPDDDEAVASLIRDDVLIEDALHRVAPSHDVLEDWALFFRVEREVRTAERDWEVLFSALGTHAGMRRALRSWIAERSAGGDEDAYAVLEACLDGRTQGIPQHWRDEAVIGLLRSDTVKDLVARLADKVPFADASLLQRISHLLRVACKGPNPLDYSQLEDSSQLQEIQVRLGMAAPTGEAWDVGVGLVADAFPTLPAEAYPWVLKFLEEAVSHDAEWFKPSERTKRVLEIAKQYCERDVERWYDTDGIGKRFFALFCRCVGSHPAALSDYVKQLLKRRDESKENRDALSEERLAFMVDFSNCRDLSLFLPDLLWHVFCSLYYYDTARDDRDSSMGSRETELGLSNLAHHEFFPASVFQGPYRHLLCYAWPSSVRMVVELCNHSAMNYAEAAPKDSRILPISESPNDHPHIHTAELWTAYRALHVTSYLINSALMALEERLLIEAPASPVETTKWLEYIIEHGRSSLTTGLVAGVLTAHPKLVTKKLLSILKSPAFFTADIERTVHEISALAISSGNDGWARFRQKERQTSNALPHRRLSLEWLVVKLQFDESALRAPIFAILDEHKSRLAQSSGPTQGWRMTLLRMDTRELTLGEPTPDGKYRTLEVANLDPELKQASDEVRARAEKQGRLTGLRLWAVAVTGRYSSADASVSAQFASAEDAYVALLRAKEDGLDAEMAMLFGNLDEDVALGICAKWLDEPADASRWARRFVVKRAAVEREQDPWQFAERASVQLRAQAVVRIAALDSKEPELAVALANVATDADWEARWATASVVSSILTVKQTQLAEIVVSGFALYADALGKAAAAPYPLREAAFMNARAETRASVLAAIRGETRLPRPSPDGLHAIKDWLVAIAAAHNEEPTWRQRALVTLVRLVAAFENERRSNDHRQLDYDTRHKLAELFASELLIDTREDSPVFGALDLCLRTAPEFSAIVAKAALLEVDRTGYETSTPLWKIWDRAMSLTFGQKSLRREDRLIRSSYRELLRVLLLSAVPWNEGLTDLKLLRSRPHFVTECLAAVGDTRMGMQYILELVAGVGRASALPGCLIQLRDALTRAPADLFADSNCLWTAETVCQVTVHEHRSTLVSDVRARRATLDILDRLVDAGSSLAFQLREYLATSPASQNKPAEPS